MHVLPASETTLRVVVCQRVYEAENADDGGGGNPAVASIDGKVGRPSLMHEQTGTS